MKKMSANVLRLAVLQLKSTSDKIGNVNNAVAKIEEAVRVHKPRLVTLPECFNSPYDTKLFHEYSEKIPIGYTSMHLSELAKKHNIYIVGGTIPEFGEDERLYNTCTIWSPEGELLAKHRKMHLFDIDVEGGIRFKESETLTAGDNFTIVEIDGHKVGIGICYDIRFEEMAKVYRNEGCKMLIYPASFNMTTGPLHWELLQRARANDNQLYVVTTSPARDVNASYVSYGHSMIIDPWATILRSAQDAEQIIAADIDFNLVEKVREQIPISNQRRLDLYETVKKSKEKKPTTK